MIHALLILLTCQLIGEAAARGLALPFPGPVLGMVLLVAALSLIPKLADLMRREEARYTRMVRQLNITPD